jgi:twitching motility protein PilT
MAKDYKAELEDFLEIVGENNASDLHLTVGKHPNLRVDGRLRDLSKYPVLTKEHADGLINALLNEEQKAKLLQMKEVDFSYSYQDKSRFRINVFYQKGYLSAALRFLPSKIRTVKQLNLPPIIEKFAARSQGFFLVVGPTSHGKTTTLAAMVDYINHNMSKHIVTIEDPIEYIYTQDKCIIEQREVGSDTISFDRALRSALRQDPDVIMLGEMRDLETISTALTAAETGHLVLATLHTNNAAQTIDRIIDIFPGESKNQVRSQLAASLLGIVSQRLVPRADFGRIPAVEILVANSAIRNLIREGKVYQLDLVIETSVEEGMVSLNRFLADLVQRKEISMETALNYSLNASDLRMLLGK